MRVPCEIAAGEPPESGGRTRDVVGVHQLDPLPMREPMVLGVHGTAVIELGLIARVEHHRVDAVLVGQGEVEELQDQGHLLPAAVGGHRDAPAVGTGGTVPPRVDLDPDRLVLPRREPRAEIRHGPRVRSPAPAALASSRSGVAAPQAIPAPRSNSRATARRRACSGRRRAESDGRRRRMGRGRVRGSGWRPNRTGALAASPRAPECRCCPRRRSAERRRSRCAHRTAGCWCRPTRRYPPDLGGWCRPGRPCRRRQSPTLVGHRRTRRHSTRSRARSPTRSVSQHSSRLPTSLGSDCYTDAPAGARCRV